MEDYQDEFTQIKELLKKIPHGLNIREISDKLKINRNSVAKYLDILTTREEVDVRIHGKAKVYYLSQNVPISDLMKFSSKYFVVLNRDLRIVQVNDAFTRFINVPKEQLLQLKISEIPTDILLNQSILDSFNNAILGNEISSELSFKTDAGTIFYNITFTPIQFHDQSCGVILIFEDITKQKEIEKVLKKSEEKYRNLIENISDVVFLLDPEGIITYVSSQITAYGYKPEEITSKIFDPFIFPGDRDKVRQLFMNILKSGKRTSTPVFRIIDNLNRPIWVEWTGRIQQNESGVVTSLLGVLRDITERKKAEVEIIKLTEKNEEALKIAQMGHWEYDAGTKTFLFNDQYYSLHGITAEDVGGYRMSVEKFVQKFVSPERKNNIMNVITLIQTTTDPHFQTQFESCILCADGEKRDVTIWLHVEKDLEGKIPKVYGVTQDITERKRVEEALRVSEARYRSLFEFLPDAVVVHHEGKIVYVNPAGIHILGGTTAEEIVGKPVLSFVHPDDHGIVLEHIQRMIDERCTNPPVEERFLTLNGGVIIVEVSSTMSIFEGKPSFIVAFRDITSRKETEESLRLSEERACLLLQNASDAIYVFDVSQGTPAKVLEVSNAGCKMLGYTREEILRMSFTDIDKSEYKTPTPYFIRETQEKGHALFDTTHCTKSGRSIPVEVGVRAFRLQGKQAIMTVVRKKT